MQKCKRIYERRIISMKKSELRKIVREELIKESKDAGYKMDGSR